MYIILDPFIQYILFNIIVYKQNTTAVDEQLLSLTVFDSSFVHLFRSRSLRTPANMFIINLAVTDFLMCVTQTPIFFTTSLHKRWIFGEKGNPAVTKSWALDQTHGSFPGIQSYAHRC